ncbi:ABC transporter permease [Rhizobium sp. NRK18]|uniref:ABC transporter permease n=1 Tax=Rhizobium sp. NRK18 TaxID=2964667 RepID=UPI0021C3CFEA|nr:ABC transporter permease [Rhizobium sp. NRK18]MCQ2006093.1 ABC transporter permease [Rhizobium sp. NRK18]
MTAAPANRRRKSAGGVMALLTPGFLLVLALFVVPLSLVVIYSFLTRGTYGGVIWTVDFDSYARIAGLPNEDQLRDWDFVYIFIFLKTALIAGLTALLALLIGYPAAWFIARQPEKRRFALLLLVTIPFFVNALVRVYAWMLILRADGLFNNILMSLGLISEPLQLIYTPGAIILAMVYQYLPFMVLPLFASVEKLDYRLVEASLDLGATRFATFRRVVIPMTWPGIAAGLVLVFIPAFGNFIAPTLIGGAKSLQVGTLLVQAFLSARDWPFGSAVATVLSIIVLAALVYMVRTEKTAGNLEERP